MGRLEARHLLGSDAVGDEAVALPVVGAADVLPVGRAIDGGEDVWALWLAGDIIEGT